MIAALQTTSPELVVTDVERLDEAMLTVLASAIEHCAAADVVVVALSAVAGHHEWLLELGVHDLITLEGPRCGWLACVG